MTLWGNVVDAAEMYAVISDVNEDGNVDIVAGGKSSGAHIGWFEAPATNRRNLASWSYHKMGDVGWTMSIIQADMDGDSDLDFVVSDRKPTSTADLVGARWLENPGTSGKQSKLWTNHFIFEPSDPSTEVMFMGLADIDRDGDLDAVVPLQDPNRLHWYERLDSSGDRWSEHTINLPSGIGSRLKAAKMADLNGDDQLDLVLTMAGSSSKSCALWFEHGGDPFVSDWLAREISGPLGEKFDDVAMVDLDGDGDLDIITTEENAPPESRGLGVIWYENPTALEGQFVRGDCNGSGNVDISDATFILGWLFEEGPPPGCIAAADTNGDGEVNIVDPLRLPFFLFGGGPPPLDPFPGCGPGSLDSDREIGCETPPKNC